MKQTKRLTSLLLALVMAFGMALPASAATQYGVSVTIDNDTRWTDGYNSGSSQTLTLMELGARDVAGVEITSGDDTDTYGESNYEMSAAATLENGTGYRFYTTTDGNGVSTLYCQITSLKADVDIQVDTKATSYTIRANSGPYGSNGNQGVSGNETCSISGSADQTVTGGNSWDIEFVPKSGYDINYLNIRPDYNNNSLGKVVSVPAAGSKDTATIAGRPYVISKASNGTVTLHCAEAARDIYVTALTEAAKATYNLTVTTDGHSSSSVTSATLTEGATKTVTLSTTTSGYNIGDVTIIDGSSQGTIKYNGSSVSVNGHSYTLTRNLDGSASLSVPAIKANVTINATSTNATHYVSVSEGRYTDSNQDGVQFFKPTDSYAITFEPDYDVIIDEIVIRTSRGTYRADAGDSYIVVEGVYYRMYEDNNGDITVYLTQVPTNMEVSVVANSTVHKVTLKTNSGCDTNKSSYSVDDGDNLTVEFTTTSSKYDIKQLRVVYNGTTYTADPRDDSYIRVNGTKWPISVASDGTVTLEMKDIEYDVTVTASTTKTSSGTGSYYISKSTDSHSNVTYTGSNPFDEDDETTIRVYTSSNYIIDSVKFTMNGKSATVEPFDSYFKLDGNTYYIDWDANDDMSVDFTDFTGSLKVTVSSVRGSSTSVSHNGKYNITKSADSHSNITFTGSNPFYYSDDSTIRVYTDNKYVIDSVKFTMNGKTATIEPFDNYFTLDGTTYYVTWVASDEFSVKFTNFTGNLTVTAKSVKGTATDAPSWSTSSWHQAYVVGTGNGLFSPSNTLTRAEAVTILVRTVSQVNPSTYAYYGSFADVDYTAWYASFINYANQKGYLSVLGSGSYFYPNQPITRAEYMALLCAFSGADVSRMDGNTDFVDVPASHWASRYIDYAASKGWVAGVGGGYFQPDRTIQRAEIVTVMNRIMGRVADATHSYSVQFSDVPVTHWAYYEIMEAANSHYAYTDNNGNERWS